MAPMLIINGDSWEPNATVHFQVNHLVAGTSLTAELHSLEMLLLQTILSFQLHPSYMWWESSSHFSFCISMIFNVLFF